VAMARRMVPHGADIVDGIGCEAPAGARVAERARTARAPFGGQTNPTAAGSRTSRSRDRACDRGGRAGAGVARSALPVRPAGANG
jgi:hypothetical protein